MDEAAAGTPGTPDTPGTPARTSLRGGLDGPPTSMVLAKSYRMFEWDCDMFEVSAEVGGRPLVHVAMAIAEKYNFATIANVPSVTLKNFFQKIEAG